MASQTPTVCYKSVESLSNLIRPRVLFTKFPNPTTKKEELGKKPAKSNDPDMGTYNPEPGYVVTNPAVLSQKWSPSPIVKFYERQIKLSSGVPAAGHYNITKEMY